MNSFHGVVNSLYLQKAAEIFLPIKHLTYDRMHIIPGATLLDVGCGPGIDVNALSKLTGGSGEVIGIDHDHDMLKNAAQFCESNQSNNKIEFIQGSANELPFKNHYFDGCRSERLFMHLKYPERALFEMYRVTKRGGIVVVADTDWSSLSIDTEHPETEQILLNYRITQVLNNGYSGRNLYRLFRQTGFTNIAVEVMPICLTDYNLFNFLSMQQSVEDQALASQSIKESTLKHWRENLKQFADNNCFYCCVNIIVVSGEKSC